MIRVKKTSGIEPVVVELEDGTSKEVAVDIVKMAVQLADAYRRTQEDDHVATAEALNAVFEEYGLPRLDTHAADELGHAVCERANDLKKALRATYSGTSDAGSPASTVSTPTD